MLGTMMRYPLTLLPFVERAELLFPEVEVVTRLPDRSLHRSNYREIAGRIRDLAGALQAAGLKKGDRVATLCWNHYAHLEAYFGVPMAGGVMHTLNLRLHPDDIVWIANHAGDRFFIVDDVLLPLFEKFRDRISPERVIVVPLTGQSVPDGCDDYETFIRGGAARLTLPPVDENDAVAMCYTSGTTGRPKGVAYTHRGLALHSLTLGGADVLGLSMRDKVMPVVPMFHANAWGLPYACMLHGAGQVYPGPFLDGESLLDLMAEEQITYAAGVPTIWLDVIQRLEAEPERWKLRPDIRTTVGGAACPESLIRRADALGVRIGQGWGMTEMSPIGTVGTMKPWLEGRGEDAKFAILAKQGLPVPFVDIRVRGDDGIAPWDGETMGELEVRGPWIADSYFENDDATDRWTEDGWFRTGDVVTVDPEGYVKITDRTKDLIKSGGEWISSVDLENALMGHPAIAEAAVISRPHEKWSERPLAVAVLRDGATVTVEELREFLAAKFAKWWVPDAIVFVEEIPRTSTGKFLKTRLREQFADWTWEE